MKILCMLMAAAVAATMLAGCAAEPTYTPTMSHAAQATIMMDMQGL